MCAEKRLTAPAAPAPAPASKGGRWQTLPLSVAQWPIATRIVLLALLALGEKNIHLGPTLPAFLSPNVAKVLVESFGIAGITDVETDIKTLIG